MKRFILCVVICLCFFATVVEAEQTLDVKAKFARGRSQKDLYDYLKEAQTDLTDLYTDYRASLSYFYDGKTEADWLIETDEHVTMVLKSAYVQLVEVPDSSTDTLTIRLYNHADAITDTITFTEGTHAVGDVQAFTVTGGGLEETAGLKVIIAGTTTTAGEVIISTEWKGSP